jgi:hypothetical protein
MSYLTIGWDRAENAADLPRDSGLVFPEPILTIAWRPMLNSAVLDWDQPSPWPVPVPAGSAMAAPSRSGSRTVPTGA